MNPIQCLIFFQIVSKYLESLESDLHNLSKDIFKNPGLLTTELPADLIRVQINLKDQQALAGSKLSQLVNLLGERDLRSKEARSYRDFLAQLEDWLVQTQASVSAELDFVASKIVKEDIQIKAVTNIVNIINKAMQNDFQFCIFTAFFSMCNIQSSQLLYYS